MNRRLLDGAFFSLLLSSLLTVAPALAGSVELPNSFTAGTRARAAQVNANFNAVKTAVDDNDARVGQLLTRVAALEAESDAKDAEITALDSRIDTLEAFITGLQTAMTLQTDAQGHPAVVFSGVNVHIRNGAGMTDIVNGRGNLIIGYNETRPSGSSVCSDGDHDNLSDCVNSGGAWQLNHKSGSHNIVLGPNHNYSRYGGLVAGHQNTVNGVSAAVSGGENNIASAPSSSVSGGSGNRAYGSTSNVSGGALNIALGLNSSVSGGYINMASGNHSSISGGQANTGSGNYSSISGGFDNTANGGASSVTGGDNNTASGLRSSISGGSGRTASGTDDWVAGGLLQDN